MLVTLSVVFRLQSLHAGPRPRLLVATLASATRSWYHWYCSISATVPEFFFPSRNRLAALRWPASSRAVNAVFFLESRGAAHEVAVVPRGLTAGMLVVCRSYAGRMRVVCELYASCMRVVCELPCGRMRVAMRPYGSCYAAVCGLLCGRMRVACPVVCACYAGRMRLLCLASRGPN